MSEKLLDLKQIAESLGISRRYASKRAEKEQWKPAKIEIINGFEKKLYSLKTLPKEVVKAIFAHQLKQGINDVISHEQNHDDATGFNAESPYESTNAVDPHRNAQRSGTAVVRTGRNERSLPPSARISANALDDYQRQSHGINSVRAGDIKNNATGNITSPNTAITSVPALSQLTTKQRETNRAIDTIVRFVNGYPGSVNEALDFLNTQYAENTLNSGINWAYEHCWNKPRNNGKLTRSTFNNWLDNFKKRGHYAPLKRDKDFTVMPWHALAVSLKQRPQGSLNTWIAEEVAKAYPGVSYWQVNRFFTEKFSQIDQLKGRHTGSALSVHKFHHTRDYSRTWPFTEVHADGWNSHFTAPHPETGEFVTLEIWHAHDTTTRYVTPAAIGLTENFEIIAKCLENCIRIGGVPAILMTDSTGSVKNDRFEYDPVASIASRAGITISHPIVGNSQANGIAENFNTYLDRCSRELATYQAKSMDKLTHKRVRKLTEKMVKAETAELRQQYKKEAERMGKGIVFDSFNQAVDWINQKISEFNEQPHRSLPKIRDANTGKMRHQSPAEAIQQALTEGWQPVAVNEFDIIDMFRPHERKKIIRGAVRLWGQRYWHDDMEHYNGQEVLVAYDMTDGSKVYIKTLEGELLFEAKFYESRDGRCQSFIEMALNKRADAQIKRLENKAEIIESRRPTELIEYASVLEIPAVKAESLPENVVAIPKTAERPFFTNEPDKYRWLMKNAAQNTTEDAKWLDWYRSTSEWEDLFGDREVAIR